MSYQFLLFDLDRTLLDFDDAEDKALNQLFALEGVESIDTFKQYYLRLNKQLWQAYEREEVTKEVLVNTRFARTFAHFGMERDGEVLAECYQGLLGQQGQVFPGAVHLLDSLMDQGYALYAITNGITAIQQGRLTVSPIAPYFSEVFISEQMGTQKPSRLFFEQVAESIPGFDSQRALVIGDSLSSDIQGALNYGLDSLWFNPATLDLPEDAAQPTAQVSDYQAILDYLLPRKDY